MNVTRNERKLIKAIASEDAPIHWSRLTGNGMTAANVLSTKKGLVKINMEHADDWSVELTPRGRDWWNQHKDD